jgi:hypothetical protein
MAVINSHPFKEALMEWYHSVEPGLDRAARAIGGTMKNMPCEFFSGVIFLSCFAVYWAQGFRLPLETQVSFILMLAAASILAAWAFLFAHHDLLRRIWALAALAGNLFLISFI